MSGGGPDMFIIACNGGIDYMAADVEALFRVPEKAMEAGLFLPLDDYIQNAQFMEWNKLNETVMAAGRTEQGQMLLPMTYTFPLTMFRESDVTLTTTAETTWQDMLNDKTNVLTAAADWIPTMEEQENFENQCGGPLLPYILGDLADYSSEKLLFTEDELLQRITDVIELDVRNKNGEFENVPPYYHWFACGGLTGSDFADPHVQGARPRPHHHGAALFGRWRYDRSGHVVCRYQPQHKARGRSVLPRRPFAAQRDPAVLRALFRVARIQ